MTRVPRSPRYAQVPGPKDMELGVPWPGGVTSVHKPVKCQRLDSVETILNKTKESCFAAPFSPASTASPVPFAWDASQTKPSEQQQDMPCCGTKFLNIEHDQHGLKVPEAALASSGGWFDRSNWIFKLTFERFGELSTEELIRAYYAREPRSEYGEDHVSTRGKHSADIEPAKELEDFSTSNKKKAVENHKVQERDRRDRHRVLQKEVDNSTPTAVYDMTEQVLPAVKEKIKHMPKEEHTTTQDHKGKKTGKDEQLTAAAIMPHLSNILIFRLFNAQSEAEARLQQLEGLFKTERRARCEAEDRLGRLEYENKRLAEEVAQLRVSKHCRSDSGRRSSTASFTTPQLPAYAEGRKNSAIDADHLTRGSNSSYKVDNYRGLKRARTSESLEPLPSTSRFRWPPSPSPDYDECQPTFYSH